MKFRSVQILSLLALLSLSASALAAGEPTPQPAAAANEQGDLNYGTVYLEDPNPYLKAKLEVGVFYGYEFSNPYLNNSQLGVRITAPYSDHGPGAFFRYGFSLNQESSDISSSKKREIETAQHPTVVQVPETKNGFSAQLMSEAIPFRGHLNIMSDIALDLSFKMRAGLGAVVRSNLSTESAMSWSAGLGATVFKRFEIEGSLGQQIEAFTQEDNRNSRTMGQVGVVVRF